MEKLIEKRLAQAKRATTQLSRGLTRVARGIAREDYEFFRDSLIKRFEFSYEVTWRLMRLFLEQVKKVSLEKLSSPRTIFRAAQEVGLIKKDDLDVLFDMVDYRNLISHTYEEAMADETVAHLTDYAKLLSSIVSTIEQEYLAEQEQQ